MTHIEYSLEELKKFIELSDEKAKELYKEIK